MPFESQRKRTEAVREDLAFSYLIPLLKAKPLYTEKARTQRTLPEAPRSAFPKNTPSRAHGARARQGLRRKIRGFQVDRSQSYAN